MKNRFGIIVAMLLGASALAACNSLEVTMPVGPQGEQGVQGKPGKDGLSAYELWVKAVQEKIIDYSGSVDISHYFLYIKGKDGRDGKDGTDGKSAYELWKEYVIRVPSGTNQRLQWQISTGFCQGMMVQTVLSLTSRMETGG